MTALSSLHSTSPSWMAKHAAEIPTPKTAGCAVLLVSCYVHYNAFIPDPSASTRPRATSFTLSTSPDDLSNTHSASQLGKSISHTIPFREAFPRLARPLPNLDPCSAAQCIGTRRCLIEPEQARIKIHCHSLTIGKDTYSGVRMGKELDDFG